MDVSKKKFNPNPIKKANILSRVFLWWMKDFLWTGFKRDLEQGDLYDVLKADSSSRLGDLLERHWNNELAYSKEKGKDPNLLYAIFKAFATQYMFSGFISLLFCMVFRVAQPLILKKVIEFFTPGNSMDQQEALMYGAGLVVNGVVMALCMHHSFLTACIVGMRIRVACCSLMYRKVMRLSKTSSGQTTTGHLVNLMSNDVNRFDMATQYLHFLWIGPMQVLLITYCLWLYVDISAFVGVVFVFLQTIPVQSIISKCLADLREKIAVRTDERVRLMSEIVSGVQVIKMYAWERPFANMVAVARRYEMNVMTKASYLRGANLSFMVFTERTSLYCTVLAYYLFGNIITSDRVYSMAQFFNALNLILAIFIPYALSTGAEAKVSVHRIQEFLMQEERHAAGNTAQARDKSAGRVGACVVEGRAKWVSGQAEDTLSGISLRVPPGSLCAVIGPVGSGKSSLLHALLRELPLHSGSVQVEDDVSYASQEPWLFVGSVRSNILFGQPYEPRRYQEVVRVCALQRDLELFPHGDKTIVGERGVSLSGGQRARINLARAVYRNADLYLLDDPLSAVDTHVGKHLFDMCLRGYLASKTRILVTHQLQYLKDADLIVILRDGKIENQGSYSEMLNSGLDFAKLLPDDEKETKDKKEEFDSESMKLSRHSSIISRHSSIKKRHSSIRERQASIASSISKDDFDPEVEEESQTSGAVKWDTYISYIRAGGNYFLVFSVFFVIALSQVSTSCVDYWSSIWTTMEEKRLFYYDVNGTDPAPEIVSDLLPVTTSQAIAIYGGLILLCVVIVLLRSLFAFMFCMRSSVRLHDTMFRNILRAKMRFFDTNPSGRILNRFSKDIGAVDELLPRALIEVIQIFLVMIGILAMVLIVNYMMIIPTAIIGALFVGMRTLYISSARSVKRLEGVTRSPVFSHLSASINGLSTIRSCKAQDMVCKEFDDYQDRHTSAWYMFLSSNIAFGIWLDNFSNIFIGVITFTFLLSPEETFGAGVGLALSQALILTGMVQYGVRMSTEVVSQVTSVERVLEYTRLDTEPALESPPDKKPPAEWPKEGCVRFLNLSLKYSEDDPPVLKDLDFIILPSHKVGIVGRTGAGKTSLISALYRLADLHGSVLIDGVDTQAVGLHDLRQRISIIPQEPVLFSASVRENLDPFGEFDDHLLWSALEEVELKESVGSLDFHVNEGGSNFSVGQRQLVCLARAILRNNRILVMDEATANVDPQTDALIQATIRNKFKDCTVLTIAHRLNTIMDSDRVLVMDAGRMMEYDHPHLLLQNEDGYFYKMVQETGPATAQQLHLIAAQKYESLKSQEGSNRREEIVTKL
ncbi:ATP-binding cassette sub-family C member 4-like [Bacillus rossius redtenbacheri]|uniref:ATP-binding cassette sub-family C member 4-like n=1 Tax=Bacillus rossius redtenbacheri TaxID=93214 RepID=UPI002FDE3226